MNCTAPVQKLRCLTTVKLLHHAWSRTQLLSGYAYKKSYVRGDVCLVS